MAGAHGVVWQWLLSLLKMYFHQWWKCRNHVSRGPVTNLNRHICFLGIPALKRRHLICIRRSETSSNGRHFTRKIGFNFFNTSTIFVTNTLDKRQMEKPDTESWRIYWQAIMSEPIRRWCINRHNINHKIDMKNEPNVAGLSWRPDTKHDFINGE